MSQYCEFEKLEKESHTNEEELIQMILIDGLHNVTHRYKMLELLQLGTISLSTCTEFIQQQELIQKFNESENQPDYVEVTDTYMLKKIITKCKFCGYEHNMKKKKYLAFKNESKNCLKKMKYFLSDVQI